MEPFHATAPPAAAAGSFAIDKRSTQKIDGKPCTVVDRLLNVPARQMWGWGPSTRGYCGETSFQMHGIFWGNWITSEVVRRNADGRELLIDVNDETAAKGLHFEYEQFDGDDVPKPQADTFLQFVKWHVDAGHLIVKGFFEKQPEGQTAYDHIMPIVGYKAALHNTVISDSATPAEVAAAINSTNRIISIYYHDLYLNEVRTLSVPSDVQTRNECRQSEEPDQPFEYAITKEVCYAIALTGIKDKNRETYRIILTIPESSEPDWGEEDQKNETPVDFTVSATISGLTPGEKYVVLRFDRDVPESDFLASGEYSTQFPFEAAGTSHTLKNFDTFRSDAVVFYRCVSAEGGGSACKRGGDRKAAAAADEDDEDDEE